jgi:hypothetical protein
LIQINHLENKYGNEFSSLVLGERKMTRAPPHQSNRAASLKKRVGNEIRPHRNPNAKHFAAGGVLGAAQPGAQLVDVEQPGKRKVFEDAFLAPPEDPAGINLKPSHPRVEHSREMGALVRDIFSVERIIRVLFCEEKFRAERYRFFEGLLISAKAGLCGSDYDIKTGELDLTLTKDEIADTFPKLRDETWKSYLLVVAYFLIFGSIGGALYYYLLISKIQNAALLQQMPLPQICIALAWIPVGVAIGIFLEFVFRMGEKVTYDGLLAINPGRWQPWKRVVSTLVTAYVFAFILGINAFQIGIANIALNDFVKDKPWLSLAIGFVTGFTFPIVRDIVTRFQPEPERRSRDLQSPRMGLSAASTSQHRLARPPVSTTAVQGQERQVGSPGAANGVVGKSKKG